MNLAPLRIIAVLLVAATFTGVSGGIGQIFRADCQKTQCGQCLQEMYKSTICESGWRCWAAQCDTSGFLTTCKSASINHTCVVTGTFEFICKNCEDWGCDCVDGNNTCVGCDCKTGQPWHTYATWSKWMFCA